MAEQKRRHFTGKQKIAILREHLIEKKPLSEVCEKHDLQPSLFYYWQKQLFEKGDASFERDDLPKVFRLDTSAQSFVVKTTGDLQRVLSAPNDTMIFIESIMDSDDAPAAVTRSSNKGAELDYGPRGPQHRENLQLQPTP